MYFPANVQDCICCIHHYIFVCIYTMMSLFMALQSPNQKTQILYCPSGAPSHPGWRQPSPNSPVTVRANLEPGAEVPAHGWALRGAATMARVMKPSGTSSALRRICHCRNAVSVKEELSCSLKSEGKAANEAALYPKPLVSPPGSLLIYLGTPGALLAYTGELHSWNKTASTQTGLDNNPTSQFCLLTHRGKTGRWGEKVLFYFSTSPATPIQEERWYCLNVEKSRTGNHLEETHSKIFIKE